MQRYFVGLLGIRSSDACSWDQQSLLPPLLCLDPTYCQISTTLHISLSELEQLALNFTLPFGGASVDTRRRSLAIGGASLRQPSARGGASLPPPMAAIQTRL
jgi:hypothetical protein